MDERTETRWPTVRDQLQQLAAGAVTSVELTQRGLTAIAASQPTLNAFRVVLTESALAEASNADRRRAAGGPEHYSACRLPSRMMSTSPACPRCSAPTAKPCRQRRTPRWCDACVPPVR